MYYSSFGILAFIHHIIINYDILKNGRKSPSDGSYFRYCQFLNSILVFYVADLAWGFAVESGQRYIAYGDTILFFAMMALSVLLWTRYVAAFLNKQGIKTTMFKAAGWLIFGFVILHLIINFFNPIIFTFTEDMEYIPGKGRYVLLVAQLFLFVMVTLYSLIIAIRSSGRDRVHYSAVCLSSAVMSALIVLQTLDAFAPFYTIGCMIANCIMHVFVEEDEKREQGRITEDVKKDRERYSRIADGLSSSYDVIYYVNMETGRYIGFTSQNIYEEMKVNESGDSFFEEARKNTGLVIHPKDRARILEVFDKDFILSALDSKRQFSTEYRHYIGGVAQYMRMTIRRSSDGAHIIIGVENIDDEVKREKEHLKALNTEKELARRDELTGIKNKTAFTELAQSVQHDIESGADYVPFAIVVCDLNDLKKVNDTEGHKAGDEYIRSAAKLLCDIFVHSPVFRIGGDEFAVFLRGNDFAAREKLIGQLHRKVQENLSKHEGPIIAAGIADYTPGSDTNVDTILERADKRMYEDKKALKERKSKEPG